jgi:hypothetical protein
MLIFISSKLNKKTLIESRWRDWPDETRQPATASAVAAVLIPAERNVLADKRFFNPLLAVRRGFFVAFLGRGGI